MDRYVILLICLKHKYIHIYRSIYTINIKIFTYIHINCIYKYPIFDKDIICLESDKSKLLNKAIKYNNINLVDYLLSYINNIHANNLSIILACHHNNDNILKILLKDPNVDPCSHNNRALHISFRNNYKKTLKVLLENNKVKNSLPINDIIFIPKYGYVHVNELFKKI